MAKQKVLKVHSPTADAWDEAVLGFNFEKSLSGYKIDAIAESVEQAILLCEQVNAEHGRALVIKKAKKLQTLFGKLAHELRSMETQKAITSVTTDKELRDLLAFSGAESSLGEAMLNAVRSMQTPFNDYLFTFGKSQGGRPVQTARHALLYCLIKNYEEIFPTPLWDSARLRLVALSTHLFPACQVSTSGLEDAVPRALEDFALWALWDRQPKLQPFDPEMLESWNANNPDDPELPMTPAQPGAE
ncbi:MAG: hypothetical protein B7Y62_06800 [Sphingomonadales bacterium 35-56-22]|jgi:hypothetical protein|uniref:hypothetical protein n=1 Tax=Sphingorhabdus sp. TaxID=1902408 RepID=UPI000BD3E5A0|nr:hypothetical protein [Sphingorhabdus sp.]OYY15323.1 MAG: hypothetical protein B7Y62_06800 [Sphingomonadales bacterium 35-56-22]OYY97187.1 MAG: hypothetical protein B7Y38_08800 [Sphingomonadales bacterium 28-56-43]OYZ60229.1 MAG: hypothetical protein B7Y10_07405 [Sphingomonadales bacterium 24-56-14]OZA82820.1 MAG: hypothetical protein B7X66_06095 [Sphingomonadales bacterium 39-57-19]HQS13153.1 hypothetical protein [Sphingorhabdus sp.]